MKLYFLWECSLQNQHTKMQNKSKMQRNEHTIVKIPPNPSNYIYDKFQNREILMNIGYKKLEFKKISTKR